VFLRFTDDMSGGAMHRSRAFTIVSAGVVLAAALTGPAPAGASGARSSHPVTTKLSRHQGTERGGTRVTLTGHGFTHVRWVKFGTKRAHVVRVASSDRIVVTSPAHAPGLVDIRVRTSGGTSASVKADHYRYVPAPVEVVVGDDVGQTFACARTTAGGLECWGNGTDGELGNGTDGSSPTPVKVKGMASGVKDVAAGGDAACAVTGDGAAKCWGWEGFGALGNGVNDGNKHKSKPSQVVGLTSGVRSVSEGSALGCAVKPSRAVACWGTDSDGELGPNGPLGLDSAVPVVITGLSGVASVVASSDFVCALTTAGAVKCWGANYDGQLGDGGSEAFSETPVPVHGLSSGVRSLDVGSQTACAVTASRAVKCWGSNGDGQLGDGLKETFSNVPVQVKGLRSKQASVSVGNGNAACAVSTGGGLRCWGYNYDGQLGNGSETTSPVPVKVKGLSKGVKAESQAEYTGCALLRNGRVKCWGYVPVAPGITDTPVSLPWFE
jgi:alpha-tubulin suppressor-like RCC1 family protein